MCNFDTNYFLRNHPQRFQKILKIFHFFSKSKNIIVFEPKLVQNHYIDQNLAIFPPKTTKMANFPLKTSILSKFLACSAPKMCIFDTQNPDFFVVRVPPEARPPPLIQL